MTVRDPMLDVENKRLREFQDGIPHLAWTGRVDGSKDYVNERWKEFTGPTREELLDWNWLDLVHPDDRVRHERDWRKAMETGERYQEQLRIRRHDGVYRWHSMRDWPTRDTTGRITHWFGTATDVDDQRQFEDHLRAAKEAAEAANRAKSEFLAMMSHEIRTPMNGIIGMTNLLLESALSTDQRGYATDARTSAEHLMVIIDSILDFSKLDAGRLQIESAPFELRDLVEDVCALLNEQAYEKHVELTCLIENDVPDRVAGDVAKVRQVLLNLIGNGVKFTTEGEVSVAVEMIGGPGGSHDPERVRFTVRDTGIGMDEETRARLFKAFTQGDSSMSRRFGGSGLGLAISKGLVEAMGGSLKAESSRGKGSVFTVELAFARVDDESRILTLPESLAFTRILCVDDNPRVLRSLQLHLRRLGANPICVEDAPHAIAATKGAAAIGRPFDVFFLDSHMPPMQGMALARSLTLVAGRSLPGKCILLTSSSRNPSTDSGLMPIAMYLQKPFRFRQVRHCLKVVGGQAADASASIAEIQTPRSDALLFQGRRVLVAEDNPINQRLVKHLLVNLGLTVDVAANGVEAVHAAKLLRYDVILMDCQMPEMDGYEATAKIRGSGVDGDVPIVALTANAMPSDRQRCFSAGMDHYLAKPFTQTALVDILSACMEGAPKAAAPGMPPRSAASPMPGPSLPCVDRDVLAALRSSMPEGDATVADLIDLFKQDTPAQLCIVRHAGNHGDGEALARAAHRLKSGCRTLGFKAMEALCVDLERAGEARRMEGVVDSCAKLDEQYALVLADLR